MKELFPYMDIQVMVGILNWEMATDVDYHDVDCVRIHPDFVVATCKNCEDAGPELLHDDYAVITVTTPIDLGPPGRQRRAICLPDENEEEMFNADTRFTVSGWGMEYVINQHYRSFAVDMVSRYVSSGTQPDVLQKKVARYIPRTNCKESYPHLPKNMLCFEALSGSSKSILTESDSGGESSPVWQAIGSDFK